MMLDAVKKAAEIMVSSQYVTALTGAGVSVESGIRPFRGPGGIWTERGEPPMDGYQRFIRDPKKYWENRNRPRRSPDSGAVRKPAEPNPGHYALAELEKLGVIKSLITQNIDNLHNVAGSQNVIEIHGNSRKLRCIKCNRRWPRGGFNMKGNPPKCPNCGGVIKGDTVMFGEPIPRDVLERSFAESNRSDCMLVIGTSAVVHPAANMPIIVKRNGGVLIEVNPMNTGLTSHCDITIQAPSGESLPVLLGEVQNILV